MKYLIIFLISFQALATVTQLRQYLTPVPNILEYLFENKNQFPLSQKQWEKLQDLRDKNHNKEVDLISQIVSKEKEIKSHSLAKIAKTEIMKTYETVQSDREKLSVKMLDLRDEIKSILDKKQWVKLSQKYGKDKPFKLENDKLARVKHVHAAPNYMNTILNLKSLNLDKKQREEFMAWQSEMQPKMAQMVASVLKDEKFVYEKALNGESKQTLVKEIKKIAMQRKNILSQKTDCRDRVLKILNEGQWNKVKASF